MHIELSVQLKKFLPVILQKYVQYSVKTITLICIPGKFKNFNTSKNKQLDFTVKGKGLDKIHPGRDFQRVRDRKSVFLNCSTWQMSVRQFSLQDTYIVIKILVEWKAKSIRRERTQFKYIFSAKTCLDMWKLYVQAAEEHK